MALWPSRAEMGCTKQHTGKGKKSGSGSSDSRRNMAPAMKAMKAMKAGGAMTATGAFSAVAEKTGTKSKDVKPLTNYQVWSIVAARTGLPTMGPMSVKSIITNYMELAASELKKNGAFKIGGCLNLKLKTKPARPARKGVNPFTKEPCVFKAKPASKTVCALPMKKLQEMIESASVLPISAPGSTQAMAVATIPVVTVPAAESVAVPASARLRGIIADVRHTHMFRQQWRREQRQLNLEMDERYEMLREDRAAAGIPNTPRLAHQRGVGAVDINAAQWTRLQMVPLTWRAGE